MDADGASAAVLFMSAIDIQTLLGAYSIATTDLNRTANLLAAWTYSVALYSIPTPLCMTSLYASLFFLFPFKLAFTVSETDDAAEGWRCFSNSTTFSSTEAEKMCRKKGQVFGEFRYIMGRVSCLLWKTEWAMTMNRAKSLLKENVERALCHTRQVFSRLNSHP
ncbi:hypothetical protein BDF20DRAFT_834534 [Mycotypha africana]|uniref:uncharacterized protein n=1 Tax=Mycotypha africana TaxID=64632 RepID=UPI002301D45B|nr:uncharacterized protein BDF20DRAFT_834534 [Mycotypha africana]KAI8981862.1 hypothetical protein BDF20DRAFT_834534 [Mycotypha africana]